MKVTIKGVLHWAQWTNGSACYQIYEQDMSNCSSVARLYSPIREVEIEVDVPDDFDPRPGIVEGMREQKKRILSDAQIKANQIDEQIQQLLSITYKPEAS